MSPPRLFLVHGPTPIVQFDALDEIVGANVWLKRDDATAGAESGNKIRKLEFLLAAALQRRARVVVTCGGLQSNHARATALTCAQLGLRSILLLRVADPAHARAAPLELTGNVLLDRLAGAEIRFVSPEEWERGVLLEQARADSDDRGLPAYIVPEGGSNGLGSLGYVEGGSSPTKRRRSRGPATRRTTKRTTTTAEGGAHVELTRAHSRAAVRLEAAQIGRRSAGTGILFRRSS